MPGAMVTRIGDDSGGPNTGLSGSVAMFGWPSSSGGSASNR